MSLRFFLLAKQLGQRWSAPVRRVSKAIFYAACALVGVLSVLPGAALPPVPIGDKAEHVIAYAALALIGCALFERRYATVILGLAAYGAALEWLQIFSPGRSPEIADGVADLVGACVGGSAAIALRHAMRAVVDKIAGGATECRACSVGGDAARSSSRQSARSSSPR
jgi:VanZ family protein